MPMDEKTKARSSTLALMSITTTTYFGIYLGEWIVAETANQNAKDHRYYLPTPWYDTCGTGWDYFNTSFTTLLGW